MPRAGTGTCTAPAGQPVVAGTAISASVFNTLVSDIYTILTASLDRSGNGGLLVPLKVADGTVALPAYSFTNEGGSGIYRAGANDIRLSIAGVDIAKWTATGFLAAAADIALLDRNGTIGIGTTNGTTITLGRVGQAITVNGTPTFAAATTFSSTAAFNGIVSGPYAWQRAIATSDTSNSTSATSTDVTGLTFPIVSGKSYLIRGTLFVNAAAGTTGMGVDAKSTGFSTYSNYYLIFTHREPANVVAEIRYNAPADLPTATTDTEVTSTPGQRDVINGYLVSTSGGTFQLCLVTEVNTSAVTIKAGSYIEWMEFT